MSLFLIVWGAFLYWLFNTSSQWSDVESRMSDLFISDFLSDTALSIGEASGGTALWFIGLLIVGFISSHLWIDRGGYRFFAILIGIGLIGIAVIAFKSKTDSEGVAEFYESFLPYFSIAMGAAGFFGIDYYRRGFRYTLTNLRIVIAKKFITLDERIVRYNHVEDVKVNQTLFGRMFGYGHVIPLTGSGIATGTEESIAVGSVGKEVEGVNLGLTGGSKVGVRKAKPSPGDCLFGVKSPIKIREIISRFIQENTGVSVAKRQEDTLERIEELLKMQAEAGQQPPPGEIPPQPPMGGDQP
jgi:hypothetical protein